MTHRQIEQKRQRLVEILNELKVDENKKRRVEALQNLSRQIGASTGRRRSGDGDVDPVGLVENIHIAFQTLTMIDMCEVASRNYVIALVAAIAALLSALAAWVAVCK